MPHRVRRQLRRCKSRKLKLSKKKATISVALFWNWSNELLTARTASCRVAPKPGQRGSRESSQLWQLSPPAYVLGYQTGNITLVPGYQPSQLTGREYCRRTTRL